jgi:superfamily II DNA or RNA helicase
VNYEEFIQAKKRNISKSGFSITDDHINPKAKDFQKFIIKRAIEAGKYAIFADTGLGKTLMQLEWSKIVSGHEGKKVIILAPFAVVDQTKEEAEKFNIPLDNIDITNYEQLDNIDLSQYCGVALDESSILKNNEGKMRTRIIDKFKNTPYKLACTATPSPNDPEELGNHAEFLDVMSYNEMLAMYFVHDSGDTGKWRLKGHAVDHFYEFVSSWAIMVGHPSDIGFDEPGYTLPPLNMEEIKVITPIRDGVLVNESAISATEHNKELRRTLPQRIEETLKLVKANNEKWIIWVKQNEEADRVKAFFDDSEAVDVRGSEKPEDKRRKLLDFSHGKYRVMITKLKIAKFGMNWQHCTNQIFMAPDFSFEGTYQGIRRSWRFGVKRQVNVYLIVTDTMINVIDSIRRKEKDFEKMKKSMAKAVNANLRRELLTTNIYDTDEIRTDKYHLKRGDCIQLIKDVPDESIGFSVFSPPFMDLFTYSDHIEDMGNNDNWHDFKNQFSFLASELFRVIKQGRNVAIHCMDLPIQKGKEGYIGLRDFSGLIREVMESFEFIYHSRVTIWKDPVTEMQRTKALGLLHKQVKKDSTMSRVGIPDSVLVFRKDGDRSDPVTNTELSVDLWQKYASPVWMDINQGDTLNFRAARDEKDEKHLCPLQLPTIKRLIHLYTNPGDTVLTPFLGVGSEVYQAVNMGRYGIGFELKASYYEQAKKNLESLIDEKTQGELF